MNAVLAVLHSKRVWSCDDIADAQTIVDCFANSGILKEKHTHNLPTADEIYGIIPDGDSRVRTCLSSFRTTAFILTTMFAIEHVLLGD